MESNGWSVELFAVEVGAGGYCSKSVLCCLKKIGLGASIKYVRSQGERGGRSKACRCEQGEEGCLRRRVRTQLDYISRTFSFSSQFLQNSFLKKYLNTNNKISYLLFSFPVLVFSHPSSESDEAILWQQIILSAVLFDACRFLCKYSS